MPTMYRLDYQTHIYTRAVTPDDEDNSLIFYYKTMYPKSRTLRLLRNRFNYDVYYNWKQHRNFSGQDKRIVEKINYRTTEGEVLPVRCVPVGLATDGDRVRTSRTGLRPCGRRALTVRAGRQPARTTPCPSGAGVAGRRQVPDPGKELTPPWLKYWASA